VSDGIVSKKMVMMRASSDCRLSKRLIASGIVAFCRIVGHQRFQFTCKIILTAKIQPRRTIFS
jgi:hypothetical protein